MNQHMTHREHQDDDQETDLRTAPDKKREAESETALPPARPRPWRWYGAILATLIVLGGGGWWLYQQLTHVVVTDARVAADIVAMSSRVPGWVTVLEVTDGDAAQRGRVLIRIDDRESRLRVEALDAQLAGIARRQDSIIILGASSVSKSGWGIKTTRHVPATGRQGSQPAAYQELPVVCL